MKFREGKEKAEYKLKFINYYKIKEFSLPFMDENENYKDDVYFEDIIHRFYWDKNLRLYFLRITKKIEISLKTNISYILGRDFGAFGYLDFKEWTDKNRYCQYYISHKEKEFKRKFALLGYETKSKIITKYSYIRISFVPCFKILLLLIGTPIVVLCSSLLKEARNCLFLSSDFSL